MRRGITVASPMSLDGWQGTYWYSEILPQWAWLLPLQLELVTSHFLFFLRFFFWDCIVMHYSDKRRCWYDLVMLTVPHTSFIRLLFVVSFCVHIILVVIELSCICIEFQSLFSSHQMEYLIHSYVSQKVLHVFNSSIDLSEFLWVSPSKYFFLLLRRLKPFETFFLLLDLFLYFLKTEYEFFKDSYFFKSEYLFLIHNLVFLTRFKINF